MNEEKKQTKKVWSKILYYGLLSLFGLIFIGSAIYIGTYVWGSVEAGKQYGDLQNEYSAPSRPPITEATEPTGGTAPTDPTQGTQGPTEPTEPQILPELLSIYEKNNELVGWISMPNTVLNYPVMQSPTRPNYYLDRGFDGKYSAWGAIYVRETCDVFAPSDNITIYGHHMKDGSMFAALDKFRHKSFWEENQYIYFDTLYERHVYQVIAAFKTSANQGEGFAYHLYENFQSEEEFNQFVATAKDLGKYYYYNDVPAQYGDKLITLSTCEYTLSNGRFVVIAKRVA